MKGSKRDSLKNEDLQSLVRLCGSSKLYLPSEYSPGSLLLPTCFRATVQYLVEHGAETRGVFRVPGSARTVSALYDYYCAEGDAGEIASTTCCPNLPSHIKAGVHDVASTFKRLLSGLPGGILGSLSLLDALVAIQGQLKAESDLGDTRQLEIRSKLIALAIGAVEPQLRRDLICAVFGLLCLIGSAAEKGPREDEDERPLSSSDLMGFEALGIVFGPLLVGDLLDSYSLVATGSTSDPKLLSVTVYEGRKERRRLEASEGVHRTPPPLDLIYMANNVTKMLITHWREVVRHMRSLSVSRSRKDCFQRRASLRASDPAGFTLSVSHVHSSAFRPIESPPMLSAASEFGKSISSSPFGHKGLGS
ncbi:hypothetical protein L209DRAFT_719681 [Thermothelomyces heterothallicus CBS 203.75]